MKVGLIGIGNMGKALIRGILSRGELQPGDILASSGLREEEEKAAEEFGICVTPENKAAADGADILILAVKPQVIDGVMEEVRGSLAEKTVVLSIAAGVTLERLQNGLGVEKLTRAMPNTPALIGEGTTAVSFTEKVTEEEKTRVIGLLAGCGSVHEIPEKLMDAVVGISGSSPAYVFMFIEAMADAGVQAGMPRALAYSFAAGAVAGSAKLMLQSGKHPGELKDMVTSPAGTTIEAVRVLEERGFRGAVMDAVLAAAEKSASL